MDGESEKRLVAYVVPQIDSLTISDLRDFLARELPDYMIPSTFVRLEALPIGPTGKVNRAGTSPAPTEENMLRDEAFVGASTPTEQRIAKVVTSLLGLENIGVNDNFFYFGGNSLFGTQVIARLREAFQVEMPLLRLFDYPTVAGLAVEVERLMVAKLARDERRGSAAITRSSSNAPPYELARRLHSRSTGGNALQSVYPSARSPEVLANPYLSVSPATYRRPKYIGTPFFTPGVVTRYVEVLEVLAYFLR